MKTKQLFAMCFLAFFALCAVAQEKEFAVVTFQMYRYDVDKFCQVSPETLKGLESATSDPKNFDFEPLMKKIHDVFFTELTSGFPFIIVDENSVISNTEYQKFERNYDTNVVKRFYIPNGYKYLEKDLKAANVNAPNRVFENMDRIFSSADGIIFIKCGYEMVNKIPGATVGIRAWFDMGVYVPNGHPDGLAIFHETYEGISKKSLGNLSGIVITSPSKLIELYESATEELISTLRKDLPKDIQKVAKKL